MSEIWFSSDQHFYHKNIIKHAHRPFDNIEEMNEAMIKNHNDIVGKNDRVYWLGDLSFGTISDTIRIVERMKGIKHLVIGNHDKHLLRSPDFTSLFNDISPLSKISVASAENPKDKTDIIMCHYAMLTWDKSHYGSWQLYGHSHGSLSTPHTKQYDVGVDCNDFAPVSFSELKSLMDNRQIVVVDHHVVREENETEVSSPSTGRERGPRFVRPPKNNRNT